MLLIETTRLIIFMRHHLDRSPPSNKIYERGQRDFLLLSDCPAETELITTHTCATLSRKLPSLPTTNGNHLTNKIGMLNALLDDTNVDIALVTETLFNKDNRTVMIRRLNPHYHALSVIEAIMASIGRWRSTRLSCKVIRMKVPSFTD